MSRVEVERRIRQLDHDVQSIYEMLATIHGTQQRHGNRLGELNVKVDSLEGKVSTLDTKLATVDDKLDRVLGLLQGNVDRADEPRQ
jgi:phage shock protein A